MKKIEKFQIPVMASLLSDGFINDPLYKKLLQGEVHPKEVLTTFFTEYLQVYYDCMHLFATDEGGGYTAWFDGDAPAPRFSGESAPFFARLCPYSVLDQYYDANYIVLDLLVVHPDYRGRGVAKQIIGAFVDFCRQQKKRAVVEIFEKENITLYQKCGFSLEQSVAVGDGLTAYLLEYKGEE